MINLHNRYFKLFLLFSSLFVLFYFQKNNFNIVEECIDTFLTALVPSLFPFILFSNLVTKSNIINSLTSFSKNNSTLLSCIIIGFLCGYPMGAKVTYSYLENGKITKKQAKFLMSFINNCNPIFILSTIGMCVLNNLKIAIVLLASHYLASIIIGLYYFLTNNIIHENVEKSNSFSKNKYKVLHKSIFDIVDESIKTTFIVLGNIFIYLTIFTMLANILEYSFNIFHIDNNIIRVSSCLLEVTNGLKFLFLDSTYNTNLLYIIMSFMLGFSGLSIIFQIYSCIYKSKIKLSHILKFKFIQGCISSGITTLLLSLTHELEFKYNFDILHFSENMYFLIFASFLFILTYAIKKVT